jgi:Tfp pilus assembly PilM family ATPase
MFSDNILIGLDIGADSIKMVEVKSTKQGREVMTFGMASHNLDLSGYWDGQRLRQLSVIIDDVMRTNRFTGVRTVISVMSKDVYVTTMDFDADWDPKRIQAEIEKQAPYFLPYPPDEMRLSWKIIPTSEDVLKYTNKQRVSITALPEFVFDNSKNLLEHINLDGIVLENQTDAQIRSLLTPDKGNTVMVDIGSRQVTFSIVVNGILRSSSYIPIGTYQITKDLGATLGVDEQVAEYFKRDLHLINLFQLPKPISDFYKILKTELNSFIQLNRKIGQSPNKVVITGGGVMTAGFYEYFSDYEVTVYLGNALRSIVINPEFKPLLTPVNNQLSTAIGLALWSEA